MDLAAGMAGNCAARARPGLPGIDAEVINAMSTVIAGKTSPGSRPGLAARGCAGALLSVGALGGGAWAMDRPVADTGSTPRAAWVAQAPAAGPSPGSTTNPVEPLSNGLVFSMTSLDIKNRLGDPGRKAGFPSCVLDYGAFVAETCYSAQDRITRLSLRRPGVQLRSGLGVGSSQADVVRVLGQPYGAQVGTYKIEVRYDGGLVTQIKVDHDPPAATPATDAGTTAADQARNNHYMNLMQLQNRLDQNGTFGHNPARSP